MVCHLLILFCYSSLGWMKFPLKKCDQIKKTEITFQWEQSMNGETMKWHFQWKGKFSENLESNNFSKFVLNLTSKHIFQIISYVKY